MTDRPLPHQHAVGVILRALDAGPPEGMTRQELVAATPYALRTVRLALGEAVGAGLIMRYRHSPPDQRWHYLHRRIRRNQ